MRSRPTRRTPGRGSPGRTSWAGCRSWTQAPCARRSPTRPGPITWWGCGTWCTTSPMRDSSTAPRSPARSTCSPRPASRSMSLTPSSATWARWCGSRSAIQSSRWCSIIWASHRSATQRRWVGGRSSWSRSRPPRTWSPRFPGSPPAATGTSLEAIQLALTLFGPDRLMVGSDWPIAPRPLDLSSGFAPLLAQVRDRDEPAARAMLHGTAARIYRRLGEQALPAA